MQRRARRARARVRGWTSLYAIGGRDGSTQVAVPEAYDAAHERVARPARDAGAEKPCRRVRRRCACLRRGWSHARRRAGRSTASMSRRKRWQHAAQLPVPTSGAAAGDARRRHGRGRWRTERRDRDRRRGAVAARRAAWAQEPMLVPRHGTAFARVPRPALDVRRRDRARLPRGRRVHVARPVGRLGARTGATNGRCRCARASSARVAGTRTSPCGSEPTWMRARQLSGRRVDRVHLGVVATRHPQHRAVGRHATHVRAAVRDGPQADDRDRSRRRGATRFPRRGSSRT